MTPETRQEVIDLVQNRPLTIDTINEICTILMLEKTTILNEQMVFDDWEMGELTDEEHKIMWS